jgi:phosphoglycolate phosphatase
MPRRFDLIVFDWDGTLLDSPAAIVGAMSAACADLGLEPPDEQAARQVIGLGLRDALGAALPELAVRHYGRLAERYRYHYLARDHELRLFPGVTVMVEELHRRGYRLGVATGKTRLGLDRAMAHSGLGRYFDVTRCADECRPKPDPAMLLEIMAFTGIGAARTLMVGDTSHDLAMARRAGVPALAVSFGAHTRETLLASDPEACVDSIEELCRWMERNG